MQPFIETPLNTVKCREPEKRRKRLALPFANVRAEQNRLVHCTAMELFFIAPSWNQTPQLNNALGLLPEHYVNSQQ